ncbi:universal stress protein [Paraburkholderia fungorum]|uniref:universal stress protein n=1 Tax=Paraburkholderia fungorum TaxID=134537 RepID=UPI00402BE158
MRAILLAYDGSKPARLAATFAMEMSARYNAHLHVLCIAAERDLGLEMDTESLVDQEMTHCEDVLSELDLGTMENATTGVAVGNAADEIIRYAREYNIDHIVVGHHGHGPLDRWMIGSVARHVVAFAPCAVTVVRDPPPDEARDRAGDAENRE